MEHLRAAAVGKKWHHLRMIPLLKGAILRQWIAWNGKISPCCHITVITFF